jgi:hypothetical protein
LYFLFYVLITTTAQAHRNIDGEAEFKLLPFLILLFSTHFVIRAESGLSRPDSITILDWWTSFQLSIGLIVLAEAKKRP